MNFYTVIDTSAFIWDKEEFDKNAQPYYDLASQLTTFIAIVEKENPRILMRSELLNEMLIDFPWDQISGVSDFFSFRNVVFPFLANLSHRIIEFEAKTIEGIYSSPDIVYKYFNENVQREINILITKIHTSDDDSVYFTFLPIWVDRKTQLQTKTKKDETRKYETIIHSEDELNIFFRRFTLLFEHNSKHDKLIRTIDIQWGYKLVNGEEIFPLSCYDPANLSVAQQLLSTAVPSPIEGGKLFNYDEVNHTFVCFVLTGGNKYHGYDQPAGRVHESIKKHFFKR